MKKVIFSVDESEEQKLADRASRLKPSSEPLHLTSVEEAIQFLRGVYSRATMTLPAFYLFHGARFGDDSSGVITGYPGIVLRESLGFSSVRIIALNCRKIFDNAPKKLSGANFSKKNDSTLLEVAEYWSRCSGRTVEDAFNALTFLRAIFKEAAKNDRDLFDSPHPLCQRIALLIQYANRSAAHLSLENYEFSISDCVHVVAAITIIGEIIRSFDVSDEDTDYFDTLDDASLTAARKLFPLTPDLRLFGGMKIEDQSRFCWQYGVAKGKQMILKQLPYSIGWF